MDVGQLRVVPQGRPYDGGRRTNRLQCATTCTRVIYRSQKAGRPFGFHCHGRVVRARRVPAGLRRARAYDINPDETRTRGGSSCTRIVRHQLKIVCARTTWMATEGYFVHVWFTGVVIFQWQKTCPRLYVPILHTAQTSTSRGQKLLTKSYSPASTRPENHVVSGVFFFFFPPSGERDNCLARTRS